MVKNRGGFTLFEVMITMAVSASMLVVAITLFGSSQRKTQFAQGMQDIQARLQDAMNDTATGYFPSSTLTCTADSSNSGQPQFAVGTSEQGTNNSCIFLGKAMHFTETSLRLYPIVGNATLDADTFSEAEPVVVDQLMDESTYKWGLRLEKIYWQNTVTDHNENGALIAAVSSPNGTGTAPDGKGYNSGIQRITTISSDSNEPVSFTSTTADINKVLQRSTSGWVAGNSVTFCFVDDNSQRGGVVVSGGVAGVGVRLVTDTDTVGCN